jgi:hypothetical protein
VYLDVTYHMVRMLHTDIPGVFFANEMILCVQLRNRTAFLCQMLEKYSVQHVEHQLPVLDTDYIYL